jgi:melanoma-associated antigen
LQRGQPEPEEANDDVASNPPSEPESGRRRRRRTDEAREEESPASDNDGTETRAPSSTDVMVKKLVRLALASEYSRQPIRRADITTKVFGEGSRQFKSVFDQAQRMLRGRFGMEMVELPGKEKVTISQRRGKCVDLSITDTCFIISFAA